MLTVIFEPDEFGDAINDVSVPVPIVDDEIDEAQEEVFVVDLTLSSSINNQITISRRSSLCRINDDDGEYATPNFPSGGYFQLNISIHKFALN